MIATISLALSIFSAVVAVFYAVKAARLCAQLEKMTSDAAAPKATVRGAYGGMLVTGESGTIYRVGIAADGTLVSETVN